MADETDYVWDPDCHIRDLLIYHQAKQLPQLPSIVITLEQLHLLLMQQFLIIKHYSLTEQETTH